MTHVSNRSGTAVPPKSVAARFIGVITAPRATFESIAAHPRWFGMLVVTTAMVTVFTVLPMTTEEGKEAALDRQVQQMESFGSQVDDAQYEGMRRGTALMPYFTATAILVFAPLMALIVSGLLFAIFNAGFGGEASFKQVFAVVVSAGVISALGAMFTGPLNYFRGEVASATNLAVLLPMLDEDSFAGRLLKMIDLFIIWWVIVLAMGLGVLYRRRTQPIAAGLFGAYAAIALAGAAIMTTLGGGQ